jgi:hypothetical protein
MRSPARPAWRAPTPIARSRAWSRRARRYRPEDTTALIARIANHHGQALDKLSADLEGLAAPTAPTVVEIDSPRAALQLISHDVARATGSVSLLAPPEAYPLLAPALRRPAAAGVALNLLATAPVDLDFAPVGLAAENHAWPGTPLVSVVDDRSAVVAYRQGSEVHGHWSTAPALVAAARFALSGYGGPA